MTDVRILNILRARFEMAWQKDHIARKEFAQFIKEIPGGIPPPDGAMRIHKAGEAVHAAHDQLMEALLALRAYENQGTVAPEVRKLAAGA